MAEGVIVKALSGFYYVDTGEDVVECRARGRFRLDGTSPLVGDRVVICLENGKGTITDVHQRKNSFVRPAVANIDCMVVLASAVNPVTDPFLIDRVTALCETIGCAVLICINKADLDRGDALFEIYKTTGYPVLRTSAVTGEGLSELREAIRGKLCAFTGNSGVGKSSLLNALSPTLGIKVGEVSDKLGRGRHTTRHVEVFSLGDGVRIADTPGFSSFDPEKTEHISKEKLQFAFPEFAPFIGKCRFLDCAHLKEPDCAVLDAVTRGLIGKTRHESYVRLFEVAAQVKDWELK
jgi:ribosome biogenesis GTPase